MKGPLRIRRLQWCESPLWDAEEYLGDDYDWFADHLHMSRPTWDRLLDWHNDFIRLKEQDAGDDAMAAHLQRGKALRDRLAVEIGSLDVVLVSDTDPPIHAEGTSGDGRQQGAGGRMTYSPAPGADPLLHETDREFVAYFDAWTREETDADSAVLSDRKRQLVRIASTIAAGGKARFGVLCAGALDLGVTPVELKEVVYQAVAYVGYATVADFLEALNDLLRDRGVELPLPDQSTTTPDDRVERGRAVQYEIFGKEAIDAGRANAADDAQHLQRYLAGNCFGNTVARGGLDLATRELVTFAFLTALGGAENQLRSHITGNLNLGNDRATLLAVITALVPAVGYPRALSALAALDEVTGG